jgi:hypothetical protein
MTQGGPVRAHDYQPATSVAGSAHESVRVSLSHCEPPKLAELPVVTGGAWCDHAVTAVHSRTARHTLEASGPYVLGREERGEYRQRSWGSRGNRYSAPQGRLDEASPRLSGE